VSSNFYPEIRRLLEGAGCVFVRHGKGSHDIWRSPITNRTFTLPRNCKRRHTANAVLKDAGVDAKV